MYVLIFSTMSLTGLSYSMTLVKPCNNFMVFSANNIKKLLHGLFIFCLFPILKEKVASPTTKCVRDA